MSLPLDGPPTKAAQMQRVGYTAIADLGEIQSMYALIVEKELNGKREFVIRSNLQMGTSAQSKLIYQALDAAAGVVKSKEKEKSVDKSLPPELQMIKLPKAKRDSHTLNRIYIPLGATGFATAEHAAVAFINAIAKYVEHDASAVCKAILPMLFVNDLTCKCLRCLQLAVSIKIFRAVHAYWDPANGDGTSFGGCAWKNLLARQLVGLRCGPVIPGAPVHSARKKQDQSGITLLAETSKGTQSIAAEHPQAAPALQCTLFMWEMAWIAELGVRADSYVCSGPVADPSSTCPHMQLYRKLGLWQRTFSLPFDHALCGPNAKHAVHWLERSHYPLPFDMLIIEFRKWLLAFCKAAQDAQCDVAAELHRSLAFQVYMYWLAGAVPFMMEVAVAVCASRLSGHSLSLCSLLPDDRLPLVHSHTGN